jgi:hypothetical protein
MKLAVTRFDPKMVDSILDIIHKTQLQFHEYSLISDVQLKKYYKNNLLNKLNNSEQIAFGVYHHTQIAGTIICVKDPFDSVCFGFDCYRITDLLIFESDLHCIIETVHLLVSTLESELKTRSIKYHINLSINNNCYNVSQIFNSLIYCGFYFIHTLLAFSYAGEKVEASDKVPLAGLSIRKVKESDTNQIAEIAQTSFTYTRFHLDPFLDNDKAAFLIKKSAVNSILEGYADIMYVAEIEDKVVGFHCAKKRNIPELEKTIGEVLFTAVDSAYTGLGIFSKLDSNLLNWFAKHTDISEMGTFLVNSHMHKTWIGKKLRLIRGTHKFSKFVTHTSTD